MHLSWVLQLGVSHRPQSKCLTAKSPGPAGVGRVYARSRGGRQASNPLLLASASVVEKQLSVCSHIHDDLSFFSPLFRILFGVLKLYRDWSRDVFFLMSFT